MIFVLNGGGAELNYTVVGGTTQPSKPKENTIWVSTDVDITGYIFSPTEPTASAGLVWIQTGNGSTSFNAIKKNSIVLRPSSVKQYIGSAWVANTAYIYQTGAWTQFSTEVLHLYKPGDVCTDETGGYKSAGFSSGSGMTGAAPSVTYNAENMYLYQPYKYKSGIVYTVNKIDLSLIKTLTMKGTAYTGQDSRIHFSVWSAVDSFSGSRVANATFSGNNTSHTINKALDVSSLTGMYYVGFGLESGYGGNASLTVTDLYGEM